MSNKKLGNVGSPKLLGKSDVFRRPLLNQPGKQQDFANTTIHCFKPQIVKNDWEMESSLAYSSYLQAVMINQLTDKLLVSFETKIDDQLTIKGERLLKQKKDERKLQNTISNGELLKEVVALVKDLKVDCDTVIKVNSATNFDLHLNELGVIFEEVSNRLYLKNVKICEDGNEEAFAFSLKSCIEAILLFKQCINYVSDDLNNLLLLLQQLEVATEDAASKQHLISDQLLTLSRVLFNRIAKKFSEVRLGTKC